MVTNKGDDVGGKPHFSLSLHALSSLTTYILSAALSGPVSLRALRERARVRACAI